MKTETLYETALFGSPDYFHETGSAETPFANLSKDSPLERAQQTGRLSKASSSCQI